MINKLFDRMDRWRHLPNYQLERRADLFFSLYLPEAIKAKTGSEIVPIVIPEFPVRIGTIYSHIPIDKSFKIDYVCFSTDRRTVFFVELKTDGLSRREDQDKYLIASQKAGFAALVDGVVKIFKATNAKRKYFCLLDLLAQAGFLSIPQSMYEIIQKPSLQGVTTCVDDIRILECPRDSKILYIQPNGEGPDVISFEAFKKAIENYDDPVSRRFGQSLTEWGSIKAGFDATAYPSY